MSSTVSHHPRALKFLFLTELWERFGFYIVQGLLVLYMTQHFGWSDSDSYTILGIFTALAYISPLAGGFLASKLLGYKNSIVWGGCFLILGYAMLAIPVTGLLYPALATIIVGTGLFKPNISSILGTQYEHHDPRRDSGFTIFYIGINMGILLAGLSSGYIKDYFGWHVSFALASMGLMIGVATFLYGSRYLVDHPLIVMTTSFKFKLKLAGYCAIAILGLDALLRIHALADWLLPCAGVVLIFYMTYLTLQQDEEYRKSMLILNILNVFSAVFWTLYFQQFYSFNLYIERFIDKNLFGIPLSTTIFYAAQSSFIILLGPLFAIVWEKLAINNKNPSPITKFMFAILCTALACGVLGISTQVLNSSGMVSPFWVFLSYFLLSVGELLLSPVGLSAVTMLAPPSLTGMMMGVWFVSLGFGGIFGGWIAKLSSIPDDPTLTNADKLGIYHDAFIHYALLAVVVFVILFFIRAALNNQSKKAVAATG
jgi:proton-dependent oligopeptide transporter, POT family